MKREHITSQSYIDWLKSMGCVFYTPLTEFETRDLISGSQMQQGNNGTVTWDANEQAWYFQDLYANVYDVVASWQNLSLPFDISNIGFSLCYEINIVQDGQGVGITGKLLPIVLGGRTVAINAQYATSQLHIWYKVAQVFPKYEGTSRYSYTYSDGNIVNSVNRGTTYTAKGGLMAPGGNTTGTPSKVDFSGRGGVGWGWNWPGNGYPDPSIVGRYPDGFVGNGENGLPNPFNPNDTNLYGAGGGGGFCSYRNGNSHPNDSFSYGGENGGGRGGGGRNNNATNRGGDATFYGAGGGGGAFSSNHGYGAGGAGYQGIVIIYGKTS